jgi:hypothetical protein
LHRILSGSITDGANGSNWPEPLVLWLMERFPEVKLRVENAAIGATGSDSACVRAATEIIARDCDLCFVEYVVNDNGHLTERRGRSREGLIRQLLAAGQDVVLVYTYCPEMREAMEAGQMPNSVGEFEELAEHYGLSSIWSGLHALREVLVGTLTTEEWLPDGLHPSPQGSQLYAAPIREFLEQEIQVPRLKGKSSTDRASEIAYRKMLPAPLHPQHWQNIDLVPLEDIATTGLWLLRRVHTPYHVAQVLETSVPEAKLGFPFVGRGLILICDFGHDSADFRYRLDGGKWQFVDRERPLWCGARGLVRAFWCQMIWK